MSATSINLNGTTPAAPSGEVNVVFQNDSSSPIANISAYMPVMTATVAGAVPTPPNSTSKFLRGDGTWAAAGGGGATDSISVASASRPATVNLTTEGTFDWWYGNGVYLTPQIAVDSPATKALGGESIDVRIAQGGSPGSYSDSVTSVSWSAGDSAETTGAESVQNSGIYNSASLLVTAPADTYQRVLRLYIGGSSGVYSVSGALSDGGATYGPTNFGTASTTTTQKMTITYTAAYNGQTITFLITVNGGINVFIVAATLAAV